MPPSVSLPDMTSSRHRSRSSHTPAGKRLGVWLAIAALGCAAAASAEEPLPADLAARLPGLISQLSSPEFSRRVAAQRELQGLADREPAAVAGQLPHVDGESQRRLVRVLEGVFLAHDDHVGESAERALMDYRDLGLPGSKTAASVLRNAARLRESRARAAMERLGSEFRYIHPSLESGNNPRIVTPATGVGFGPPAVLDSIVLPDDWKGTPDDLWHLRRLEYSERVVIYDSVFNAVQHQDLMDTLGGMPGFVIEQRGAFLGLRTPPFVMGDAVRVEPVPGSAADLAGVKPEDEVLSVNGIPVESFAKLVQLLAQYRPGEEIELRIRRQSDLVSDVDPELGVPGRQLLYRREVELTLRPRLTSWTGHLGSTPNAVDTPPPFRGPLGENYPPSPSMPMPLRPEFPPLDFKLR